LLPLKSAFTFLPYLFPATETDIEFQAIHTMNLIAGFLVLTVAFGAELRRTNPHTEAFHAFMKKNGRNYKLGSKEYKQRLELFSQRTLEAEAHNLRPDERWKSSANHLWDYTEVELREMRGWNGLASSSKGHGSSVKMSYLNQAPNLPEEMMNWTRLESLKEVANQGHCGSCWAVSSSVVLKSNAEIHGAPQRSFSAQELIDCVPNPRSCGGEGGCKGATVELALNYVMQMGLNTDGEEPYLAQSRKCELRRPTFSLSMEGSARKHGESKDMSSLSEDAEADDEEEAEDFDDLTAGTEELAALEKIHQTADFQSAGYRAASHDSTGLVHIGLKGWEKLPENEYIPLMRALYTHGPVGVSVAAKEWHRYGEGIFDGCSKDAIIDHAVTLIGYGKSDSDKYWLIQNSWGPYWGEDGRIRLLRRDDEENYCGTDSQPEKGTACKGGPTQVKVCGMCGILYDSALPHFLQNGQ